MLTNECGHHCTLKDGIERHCNCKECHNGNKEHIIIGYSPVSLNRDNPGIPAQTGTSGSNSDTSGKLGEWDSWVPSRTHGHTPDDSDTDSGKSWQSLPEILNSGGHA